MKLAIRVFSCLFTFGLLSSQLFADSYTYQVISVPGSTTTTPNSVNDSGQIVGTYTDGSGTHGFLYSNGSYQTLRDGGMDVTPLSINNAGQYVASSASGYLLYSNGTFTPLNAVANNYPGPGIGPATTPLLGVSAINNAGQILAITGSTFGSEFLIAPLDLSSYTVLVGGAHTFATGFNDSDAYVFFYGGPAGDNAYGPGGQILTPQQNALSIIPEGINNSNVVVGWYSTQFTSTDVPNGFIYQGGVSTTFDYPGSYVTELSGINNLGEIIGSYGTNTHSANTSIGFAATPQQMASATPEPGATSLIVAGLAFLAVIRRRR